MNRLRIFLLAIGCISISAGAVAQEKPTPRTYIVLPRPASSSQLPFSDAVLVGSTLYISGRLGTDFKTGTIPADLDEEIRNLLDGFKSVLEAANMSLSDLVSVQVFCPDLSLYDKFNAAYRARFSKDFPARAFIGSGPLLRGAHFEMVGIAAR
jgi:enamine deaminase RidA (YjgF/YER057c/UK114 family)